MIGTKLTLICGLLASMAGMCFAEDATPAKYFHLDFVIKQLDEGKVVNARHYWTNVATLSRNRGCSIRTGSKIPIPSGSTESTTYTFVDVGVNIDCGEPEDIDGNLSLFVTAEVSSAGGSAPGHPPVIHQNKWNARVIVPLNKATMIFSSDDLASKGQTQVELTATPVK